MAGGVSVKGIIFSYVYFDDGFEPDSTNRGEMGPYVQKQIDLTISNRKLGFGSDTQAAGRTPITASEYKDLMNKCDNNVPAGFQIMGRKVYLIQASGPNMGQAILYDLSIDMLNRCLRPGAIKYSPAVYIVIEPTEVAEPTLTRPLKKPRSKKALRALLRIDALLDRLLTTL
jgi:hypothetical protein